MQDCVELGKRACAAIDKQGKIECWGFAINAQEWGIQMHVKTNKQMSKWMYPVYLIHLNEYMLEVVRYTVLAGPLLVSSLLPVETAVKCLLTCVQRPN